MSIGKELVVQIVPKVPVDDIFRMLEFAYGLKTLEGNVRVKDLGGLYEHLALLLARMVKDRARRGLYQGYVGREESLPYLRGKLSIPLNLLNDMRAVPLIGCSHEDNCADIEDNQILAWTLFLLPRLYIKRPEVVHEVRTAYHTLAGNVTLRPMGAQVFIGRSYSHLNEDYRLMHAICRFFLDNCGPTLMLGQHEFVSFLVNMPLLFQNYVVEWLRRNMPPNWSMYAQYPCHVQRYGTFHVDIVIRDLKDGPVMVLDTKYKAWDRPQSGDIHRTVSYSHMVGVKRAALVFPFDMQDQPKLDINGITIDSLSFDIGKGTDIAGQEFLVGPKHIASC